jgi:hypothetical protein
LVHLRLTGASSLVRWPSAGHHHGHRPEQRRDLALLGRAMGRSRPGEREREERRVRTVGPGGPSKEKEGSSRPVMNFCFSFFFLKY